MKAYLFFLPFLVFSLVSCNQEVYENHYISSSSKDNAFPLHNQKDQPVLCIHTEDFEGVGIALDNLKEDLGRVSGVEYPELTNHLPEDGFAIIAGTVGKSPWIDELISKGFLDADELKDKWEKFIITTIKEPFPGIESALVIAGSDKRGTIYGIYDISEKIGVSPWYFWADVPVIQRDELYVKPGIFTMGEPSVQYRGIFINDEAPALSGWVHENFGSFNHLFYENVFELILRLKGNYLWPAMWGRAFYDDDSINPVLADTYGVVIGTSHHEPLMRAHDEWRRYGEGPWNYEKNQAQLQKFWREGVRRMGNNESVITVGMRGDGDEPMTEGTAISLLERIVRDQRSIIEEETGEAAHESPQCWALYKEVQEYYDKGMRVPEDITLLLCDDNWGNIRKLPKKEDRDRKGGFGIYYHFDYVGGPRNYKWLNTTQIERTWEQMHLAFEYGAKKLWIVNVGDIKPMELPISFFLDYAWNPEAIKAKDLPAYYTSWVTQQFGTENRDEIADILAKYTKYNSRRKPEMLSLKSYSLDNYREFENVVREYRQLAESAQSISDGMSDIYRDAFFQLVLYPVQACANLNELYYYTALNYRYANEGRASTNVMADKVEELFARDAELTRQYHEDLAGGKWNHMMSQTHIGYTYWQEPPRNTIPEVKRLELPSKARMGVSVEGNLFDSINDVYILPEFDVYNDQAFRITIFNKGTDVLDCKLESAVDWLVFSSKEESVLDEKVINVSVNWKKLSEGKSETSIKVLGTGREEIVKVLADNTKYLDNQEGTLFLENNGVISIEAEHYSKAVQGDESVRWEVIPNLGRTASSVRAVPVNNSPEEPGGSSPHLEYDVFLKDTGRISLLCILSPTLNFHNSEGRRIAVSVDDNDPVIRNIHEGNAAWMWNNWVGNNSIYCSTDFQVTAPGKHTIKYWLVDPGLVLQKLIVNTGRPQYTYLGPPESYRE